MIHLLFENWDINDDSFDFFLAFFISSYGHRTKTESFYSLFSMVMFLLFNQNNQTTKKNLFKTFIKMIFLFCCPIMKTLSSSCVIWNKKKLVAPSLVSSHFFCGVWKENFCQLCLLLKTLEFLFWFFLWKFLRI